MARLMADPEIQRSFERLMAEYDVEVAEEECLDRDGSSGAVEGV